MEYEKQKEALKGLIDFLSEEGQGSFLLSIYKGDQYPDMIENLDIEQLRFLVYLKRLEELIF